MTERNTREFQMFGRVSEVTCEGAEEIVGFCFRGWRIYGIFHKYKIIMQLIDENWCSCISSRIALLRPNFPQRPLFY